MHITKAGYDALGQVNQTVDAAGNVTRFTYLHGLLQKIPDANGNESSYGYSATRDLASMTNPDGAVEMYNTNNGVLFSRTDRLGHTIRYAYDQLGRVFSALYDNLYDNYGGRVGQFYIYDGQKLIEMDDEPASVIIHHYSYDSLWRLVTDAIVNGETKSYTYQGNGSLLGSYTIQPPSGTNTTPQSVSYLYTPAGQVTGEIWSWLPSAAFTFAYSPTGNYSLITFPNGQQRHFTYDNQDRLTNITNTSPGGATTASFDYGYDYDWPTNSYAMLGQRTSVTATAPAAPNIVSGLTKYSYDSRYQLVRADYPNSTYEAWTYDAIGNRMSRRQAAFGFVYPYTYYTNASGGNTQRLRNDTSTPGDFTYDAAGNLTGASGISNAYVWDYAGRLLSYGGNTYTYDVFGRTSTTMSGSATRYISMNGITVGERNTTTGVATDYVFGPEIDDTLAKRAANGSITYYGIDGLGSVVVATDATGAVLSSTGYSPWGETIVPTTELFGYTGRETGGLSWYYRSRYYDSQHGRFLSEDTSRFGTILQLYSYVNNSPTFYTDPLGFAPWQSYVPNPWGCQWLIAKCHDEASCCAKKFDYNKVGEDDATTALVSNTGTADPVWTECFRKSKTCGAMLMKCKGAMNPFNPPGVPRLIPTFQEIKKWLTGND